MTAWPADRQSDEPAGGIGIREHLASCDPGQEVARLLRQAEDTAASLLRGHRDTLDRVIGLLLERETIDGSDLAAIVGPPGPASRKPAGAELTLT